MSKLVLRIHKYLDSDGDSPPEAFARIQTLDPSTGRSLSPHSVREERVPISAQQSAGRDIDVTPGHYYVEAVLPSGEILADSVEVKEGVSAELVLKADASPHEWLGWQHLMGNIYPSSLLPRASPLASARLGTSTVGLASPPVNKRKASAKKAAKAKRPRSKGPGLASAHQSASARLPKVKTRAAPSSIPRMEIGQPIHWLSHPLGALANDDWISISKLASSPTEWLTALNNGAAPRSVLPFNTDPERAIYRLTHGGSTMSSATPLQSNLERDFAVVTRPRTVELVSLPLPWAVVGTGREAVVEVVVQQLVRAQDFATSIAVRDERLGLLLGFLSSGAMVAAQQIAEGALDMLFGKTENPLAAAAGGYAMVGTESDSKDKDWHAWIHNLMTFFPHVPDGAIQWATLLHRRGPSQSKQACEAFKAACRRGPPYYSLGLRWLLDGLERFSSRDAEVEAMARAVRSLASRMHQQSAFTIIRLGER